MLITFILGVMGVMVVPGIKGLSSNGDVVEQYTAVLSPDGTLVETFTYNLKSTDTRMLYRYWEEELQYNPSGAGVDNIVLMRIEAPAVSVSYIRDYNGFVTIVDRSVQDSNMVNTILGLAYRNEAGCYKHDYFSPGRYTITYTWKLNFRIDSDGATDHLNLMLADQHISYENVRIVLEDATYLDEIFQHPPSLTRSVEGNNIVITGSSGENELLEIEMLMKTGAHGYETFLTGESNIRELTERANTLYSTEYWAAYVLGFLSKATVQLMPIILVAYWMRYGVEEDATVPPNLSTVPNPSRKPWVVNLVFDKDINSIDGNAFYSTLLDLDRRKKINIEPKEDGMKIYIHDTETDDSYEKRVLNILTELSKTDQTSNPVNVFDTDTLKAMETTITMGTPSPKAILAEKELPALMQTRYTASTAQMFIIAFTTGIFFVMFSINAQMSAPGIFNFTMGAFFFFFILIFGLALNDRGEIGENYKKTKKAMKEVAETFIINGSKRLKSLFLIGGLFIAASAIIYIIAPVVSNLLLTPAILGIVAIIQVVIARYSPPTLFGKWREGNYKEKLEWDAFRNHLSDYAQLRKYSTEDLSMWGSWLVYGTALGVGDKVAKAMKDLNIQYAPTTVVTSGPKHFHSFFMTSMATASSGGGSGYKGGGGHKGGGGGHRGGGGGRGRGGGGRR